MTVTPISPVLYLSDLLSLIDVGKEEEKVFNYNVQVHFYIFTRGFHKKNYAPGVEFFINATFGRLTNQGGN